MMRISTTALVLLMLLGGCSGAEAGDSGQSPGDQQQAATAQAPDQYPTDCEPIVPPAALKCWVAACATEDCGAADSIYNQDGCSKTCTDDGECGDGEHCVEKNYAPVSCDGGTPCECGHLGVAKVGMFCLSN